MSASNRCGQLWRVATLAAIALVTCSLLSSPARADGLGETLGRVGSTSLGMSSFTVAGYRVKVEAGSYPVDGGFLCVEATRSTIKDGIMTMRWEYAGSCFVGGFAGYRFDAIDWKSGVSGPIKTRVFTERFRRVDDEWKSIGFRVSRKYESRIDVSWRGTGASRIEPIAQPSFFYAPPFVWLSAGAKEAKRAVVSGSIRFQGLGINARLPRSLTGSMTFFAGT